MERNYKYYQDGNTVRKVYEIPEPQKRQKKNIESKPRRKPQDITIPRKDISLGMTLVLALAVIVSVWSCILYLGAQSQAAEIKKEITTLENSVATLATKNDSIEYEIDSFIDVEYIMKVATEELGMVMIQERQIVTYETSRNEYMEQYADVPEK